MFFVNYVIRMCHAMLQYCKISVNKMNTNSPCWAHIILVSFIRPRCSAFPDFSRVNRLCETLIRSRNRPLCTLFVPSRALGKAELC